MYPYGDLSGAQAFAFKLDNINTTRTRGGAIAILYEAMAMSSLRIRI